MIKKVLVALDYPAELPQIFEQAVDLAVKYQASLYIFHCIEPHNAPLPEVSAMAAYGGVMDENLVAAQQEDLHQQIAKISAWLQEQAAIAQEKGLTTIKVDYKVGESREEICTAAKEWDADIIVIGRRGLRGLGEMLLGSVSNYIVHHALCSVMVVQHED
jgi:nucleotide-binding universal stress UspA family protein